MKSFVQHEKEMSIRMTIREWGEGNGYRGACSVCGRKTWIEFGCAPVCMSCALEDEPPQEPDALANLGMSEEDFR